MSLLETWFLVEAPKSCSFASFFFFFFFFPSYYSRSFFFSYQFFFYRTLATILSHSTQFRQQRERPSLS